MPLGVGSQQSLAAQLPEAFPEPFHHLGCRGEIIVEIFSVFHKPILRTATSEPWENREPTGLPSSFPIMLKIFLKFLWRSHTHPLDGPLRALSGPVWVVLFILSKTKST